MSTHPDPAKSAVHVLGIRHHGPGSAQSVRKALEALRPGVVLIEGPPDADDLIALSAHEQMTPPVALLIYRPEKPRNAAYYPFAAFSPEWQAMRYALAAGVRVRFMDLAMAHQFGAEEDEPAARESGAGPPAEAPEPTAPEAADPTAAVAAALRMRVDPLQVLAEAAGFGDGERWWEHVVEHRRDGADLFAGILEAMTAVRDSLPPVEPGAESVARRPGLDPQRERRREASMRQTIRAALAEGHRTIAVICGAWHAPALAVARWPAAIEDAALVKGLPKTQVAATWVPWTYGRLGSESGYGAGVESPGWYDHLWTAPDQVVTRWMTRAARLLRAEGLDASSASVIEAVRLAEALATLRERHLPGLDELNEAVSTVLCSGDDAPMRLIRRKLIVGERLGRVPGETPRVPLIRDLERLQKRLRLHPDPAQAIKELDLREATDLERSRLLHRLNLLEVPWGRLRHASGKGTFKESWLLQWQPEFAVALIEASRWGVSVPDAAAAKAGDLAGKCPDLPALTALLDRAIVADLPAAVERIVARLEEQAAVASDVTQLMNALPPLADLLRYGNVRRTDAAMVAHVTDGLVARVCVGLPGTCSSLDDDAAAEMFNAILKADAAIGLLQSAEHRASWHGTLARMSRSDRLHGLVAGRRARILLDAHEIDAEEAARRMSRSVSTAADPARAAAWIDGFLRGSGELLYHDDALFGIVDGWLSALLADVFPQLLPLLRRTFSTFEPPLHRNLGEKACHGASAGPAGRRAVATDFDETRAAAVLPRVAALLSLAPVAGDGTIA